MTRGELTAILGKKINLSAKKSAEFVDLIFKSIAQTLERGEAVKISGFGNFTVCDKRARIGRNSKTGEKLEISSRRVVAFQPSHLLRKPVGEGPHDQGEIDKPSQKDPEHGQQP
jgi:integration host factor subunit alpha